MSNTVIFIELGVSVLGAPKDLGGVCKTVQDMRDCIQFILPRPRSNIGRSSFKYRAAFVWNNLPVDLKKITSYDSLKKRLSKKSKILETIDLNNFSFKQRDNHFNYF